MSLKLCNSVNLFSISLVLLLLISNNSFAQKVVVVVPLAGDDVVRSPSFRIVPTTANDEAATSGRLEFTSDENPTPKSNWGKVCDDCFEGNNFCPLPPTPPRTHSAAVAVCKDLGYETGIALTGALNSIGSLGFSLDNVVCPDNAQSFDECTSSTFNTSNCILGEEVDIQCFAESPKIVFPGFTLDCAVEEDVSPFDFSRINDNDLSNPLLEDTFDDDVVRSGANVVDFGGGDVRTTFFLEATGGGSGNYLLELICLTGAIDRNTSDTLLVSGTSGLRWKVSTSLSHTASTITVSDIIFELNP